MAKVIPIGDRVLIKPDEPEGKSKGGILLPDQAKERPRRGRIIEVGEGARDEEGKLKPVSVRVDDVVLYAPYTGNEIEVEGVTYLMTRESELLAIVRE